MLDQDTGISATKCCKARAGPGQGTDNPTLENCFGLSGGGGSDFDDGVGELAQSAHEDFDNFGVELGVGTAFELREGFGGEAALLVSAVAGDGVVGVGDGDNARAERDLFADETVGVARAIEEFMMVQNHLANVSERSEGLENLRAELNVRLHGFPFIRIERAALVQNIFGNADLADVVEHGAKSNFFDFYVGHAQGFGDKRGVSGNLLR